MTSLLENEIKHLDEKYLSGNAFDSVVDKLENTVKKELKNENSISGVLAE